MEVNKMENRINQLKADAVKLLDRAGTVYPVSLVNDPGAGVNVDAWERYRMIVNGFIAAKEGVPGILAVRYQTPDEEDDSATVTIKLGKACTFSPDARTALALAAALADLVTATTDGDKMWLNFSVSDIWAE